MTRRRIRGARVLDPASGRDEVVELEIENGRIAALASELPGVPDEVIEAEGLWLAPGLVDLHTHLREPGGEYKEDIASGARAAAKGGFTTVACPAPAISDVPGSACSRRT